MKILRIAPTLVLLLAVTALSFFSCEKENETPVVQEIRAYLPSPNDSVLSMIEPGTWIVIKGSGFGGARSVLFNGYPAQMNVAFTTESSIVVLVPADIPFAEIADADINTITVVGKTNSLKMPFTVAAPKPDVTAMSNEMANEGDVITLYGTGLFAIQKITFAGGAVATTFKGSTSGTSAVVTVPPGAAPGALEIVTKFGTGTSTLKFNDHTGMLCDFDDVNNQDSWNNLVINDADLYPGNRGKYGRITFETCPAGDWGDWQPGRGIRTTQVQWVPVENLDDPTAAWAVKFEVFVKNPWSDGCIFIHDWSWGRTCRYEPWRQTTPYKTTGWTTVTIPLTNFKTKINNMDGTGTAATTVRNLLVNDWNGNDGKKYLVFLFNNPTAEVKNFDAAIDNIRVVKLP